MTPDDEPATDAEAKVLSPERRSEIAKTAANAREMGELEKNLLIRCAALENITSSDRPSDRARTRLKKLGYIIFDREKWRWQITYAGQDALAEMSRPSPRGGE